MKSGTAQRRAIRDRRHRACRRTGTRAPRAIGMVLVAVGLAALVGGTGCAGMTPAPRYTNAPSAGGAGLQRELQTRQQAMRTANPSRLMRVVESYLGVPYKWGGTTRAGMDCSALTRAVYREAYGVELPRTSKQMYRLGKDAPRAGLRAGDLVFFRIDTSGPGVSHVGIYVGDGRFAHASSSRGGVIDPLASPYFDKRYAGARRVLP
jgi:cell wall-associated NlpC family hydrolase